VVAPNPRGRWVAVLVSRTFECLMRAASVKRVGRCAELCNRYALMQQEFPLSRLNGLLGGSALTASECRLLAVLSLDLVARTSSNVQHSNRWKYELQTFSDRTSNRLSTQGAVLCRSNGMIIGLFDASA